MILFQLTLMPLVLIGVLLAHRPRGREVQEFLENVAWGIRSFACALVPYVILSHFVNKVYTHRGIFLYHTLHDYLYWGVAFLGGYFLLYEWTFWPDKPSIEELSPHALGFFLFSGVVDGVVFFGEPNVYSLFLMPLERLGIIAGSVYLLSVGRDRGFLVVPMLILALSFFLLGGVGALLFYSGYPVLATIFTAVITLLGGVPHLVHRLKGGPLLSS